LNLCEEGPHGRLPSFQNEEDRAVFVSSCRPLGAAFLAAIAVGNAPIPAIGQQVTVTVNGQPLYLNPGPIERAGRVFVPLRGIFERLGAGVVYSAGTINATKASTTVSLHIGSTQATVNGQLQYLDVAPFIVGATTYVPLRFIAQSLGANVGYDESTRVVAIQMAHPMPPPYPPPRPPAPIPPPNPPPAIRLRAQQPAPDSETTDRFAVIAAEFTRPVDAASVRVWLDGANRTLQSGVSATGFSYKPPAPLSFGTHTVRVAGRAPGGVNFDRSWSFSVARSAPEIQLTIYQPAPNAPVGRSFTIRGNTVANARVRVTAGASPSSTGQFTGTATAGPKGNFSLQVTLATLPGQQTVTVKITATDPVSLRRTETSMRLRLNQ
jgi:Copper amine oxidase N-terminal domain